MPQIVLGTLAVVVLLLVVIYNRLVGRRNAAHNALSGIDTMLKKRFDLIPNLVATVRQYAQHEERVLAEVASLRGQLQSARGNVESVRAADAASQGIMRQLLAVAEASPVLKADASFMHLQRTLHEVEEQLSAARRSYNAAVTDFNDAVMQVPSNIVAGVCGFRPLNLYATTIEERQNVNVRNLFSA